MKIADIDSVLVKVNHRGDWVFVLVQTDEGLTGLGEISHSGNGTLVQAALDIFKPELIGENPLFINELCHRLAGIDGGRIVHTLSSGIEQALWDIKGQRLGIPIHALLGGALRGRIRLYANINRHLQDRSPGRFAEAAALAAADGVHRLAISPHNPSGPVATAASGQVAAKLSNFFILEYAWGEVSWRKDLLDPPERIEDGIA